MNSAPHHTNAATKAGSHTHGALRAALACALACMACLGSGAALAQHGRDYGNGNGDDQAQQQQQQQQRQGPERHGERFQLPPQDRDQRQAEMRAYDDQRRQQQYQQDKSRSSGRMTPDERRDLRRQINEANIDLYPQRR